ncbi:MAG: hypothetical protein NC305_14720 [Lachnospiraceae bacterium]|nr:hypothetical protein [Butyrivibrio sp.]MCM1344854.1 hypothetical protein [Muribaculaceae bacterium]MCM1411781.1 hypothetical protein [Lachnospiraceae bacterium]
MDMRRPCTIMGISARIMQEQRQLFLGMRDQAQVFMNRKKAAEAMKYADRYASGSEIRGRTEVVKLE